MLRVLVPIDFSVKSSRTLRYASELAAALNARVSLIYVFAVQPYNRKYNFDNQPYREGVKNMLKSFYQEHVEEDVTGIQMIALKGNLVETLTNLSRNYNLMILSGGQYASKFQRWLSSRSSTISSTARCPVLLVPPESKFSTWKDLWHINRRENESIIVKQELQKLNLGSNDVQTKSLDQKTFSSPLWESIVRYIQKPKSELQNEIIKESQNENTDLLILVSHGRDSFESFVDNEAIQIIFRLHIPILIFQDPEL